jgi:hypothetical protein
MIPPPVDSSHELFLPEPDPQSKKRKAAGDLTSLKIDSYYLQAIWESCCIS